LISNQIQQNNLDSESVDILARCSIDTKAHSRFFFPDVFHSTYSTLHDKIVDILNENHPRTVIAAPRGLGKTSTILFGVISRYILFQLTNFIVYITNSGDNAILQTENLKYELLTNPEVRKFFGPINYRYEDDIDERFSKKAWVTSGNVFVLPRGSGQQVRGLLYHSSRPGLIAIDDLEDKELVASDVQRKKIKEWFYSDLMKCGDRYKNNSRFIYIDTLKHEDSILQELLESPEWLGVRLEICDDLYHSNAPEFMSDATIATEVAEHIRTGTLDIFYREMRNIPVSKENASFKPENFKHYREVGDTIQILSKEGNIIENLRLSDIISIIITDPAKEVQIHNADTAIVCIGILRGSKKLFVRDIDSAKMYPDQIYKRSFEMARRNKAHFIFYEKTSLHKFIEQPFENQRRIEDWVGRLEGLNAEGKKEERIAHLAPYYSQGYVYHKVGMCTRLESQLTAFPRSKLWDIMDATAYIIKIMDENLIYFDSGEDVDNPPDDEYDELDDVVPLRVFKRL